MYLLLTEYIFVFCMNLSTNIHYFALQQQLIGFCNGDRECLLCRTNWICKCNSGDLSLERAAATFHAMQSELVTMSLIKSQINIRKSSTCVVCRVIVHTICIILCLSDHIGICCTGSSQRGDLVIRGRGFQLCVPMSIQAWLIWWMIRIASRRETAVTVGL